jgi:hypothetical protein
MEAMTFDERYAVLSALIDREMVDPDAVAAALDDAAARAMLVDFMRLRVELQREDAGSRNVETGHATTARHSHFRTWRLAAAILLPLAVGVASGWWIGDWSPQAKPPTPDRVLSFTPGVDWR